MVFTTCVYLFDRLNYNSAMLIWIYKGAKRPNTYLYTDKLDDFSRIPDAVQSLMGDFSLVMEVDLATRDRLAQANIDEVREKLAAQGFYIQMPPGDFKPEKIC